MQIQHTQNEKGGRFYLKEPEELTTELVYKMADPQKMIIEHTQVNRQLEGKGIGHELVAAAVNYARQHHIKILPYCTFAKTIMERSTEYQDVLASFK